MSSSYTIQYTDSEDSEYSCTIVYQTIENVSLNINFSQMTKPDDVLYWASMQEDITTAIVDNFAGDVDILIDLRVQNDGVYETRNGDREYLTKHGVKQMLSYDEARRYAQIARCFRSSIDPQTDAENTTGSELKMLQEMDQTYVQLFFPNHYAPQAMSVKWVLENNFMLSHNVSIPYNRDKYCFMHCIYSKLHYQSPYFPKTSLNNNVEYMEGFQEWFDEYQLDRFYHNEVFLMGKVAALEDLLEINLCVYTFENDEVTPFFRSAYTNDLDTNVDIIIIPNNFFHKPGVVRKMESKIAISNAKDVEFGLKTFLAKINIKNVLSDVNAHACLFNKQFLKATPKKVVCDYCDASFKPESLEKHQETCLNRIRATPTEDRARIYKELKDPVKQFSRFKAFYRVPFCTADFETKLVNGEHKPFSYTICYFNVFDVTKSKIVMKNITETEDLIADFIADCKAMTIHNYDLQNVEHYTATPKPDGEQCPWCLSDATAKNPLEYNHSHWEGDNLNLEHNRWICHRCNMAVTLRNKPLKILFHNGSKFDFSLFSAEILNDESLLGHSFIAKTESRFSEISLQFGDIIPDARAWVKNYKYKMSFNDSRMLLSEPLAALANAWILPEDLEKYVAPLLQIHYKDQSIVNKIKSLALKKAVFPYGTLNEHEKFLKMTEPVASKDFYDTLSKSNVSDEDYQDYLTANSVLKESGIQGYTFEDYHNFYLLLDGILLAIVLQNFSTLCYEINGTNPLQYLSASSYSFDSLLKANKYSGTELIEIPKVEVQKWLQKSIHGGYTQVLNKQNIRVDVHHQDLRVTITIDD
jgi:hypothetical protein